MNRRDHLELQNIPVPVDPDKRIRDAFVPKEGTLIPNIDYSSIELRLIAQMEAEQER